MIRKFSLGVFVLLLVAGLGVSVGFLVARQPTPASLAQPTSVNAAPTTQREFTDSRNVTVTVTPGKALPVTSPRTGRLTEMAVFPSGVIKSGDRVFELDGTPVRALATSIPLWRPLERDMEGKDVDALQVELARLGYSVEETGRMDWATRYAAADLLDIDDGAGGIPETIPFDHLVWIPSPSVTVEKTNVLVGQQVEPTTDIFTLAGADATIKIKSPSDALVGQREITLGDIAVPVDEDGNITDQQAVAAVLTSSQYVTAKENAKDTSTVSFQVEWRLAAATEVTVIPPGALFGLSGDHGCVAHNGMPVKVQVVTSQVGQTYIIPEISVPSVDLKVEGLSCPSR